MKCNCTLPLHKDGFCECDHINGTCFCVEGRYGKFCNESNPNVDSRLDNKEPNPAIVIGTVAHWGHACSMGNRTCSGYLRWLSLIKEGFLVVAWLFHGKFG